MNKTLTIKVYQDPSEHIDSFIKSWYQFGSVEQIAQLQYKLIGPGDKACNLSIGRDEITIEGEIPSVSFMLIDKLSRECEEDKVLEGEVIDKNQTSQADFNNPFGAASSATGAEFKMPMGMNAMFKISGMSKFKLILLMLLALPLLIIMLPIIFVVAIYKIIVFKLRFK